MIWCHETKLSRKIDLESIKAQNDDLLDPFLDISIHFELEIVLLCWNIFLILSRNRLHRLFCNFIMRNIRSFIHFSFIQDFFTCLLDIIFCSPVSFEVIT